MKQLKALLLAAAVALPLSLSAQAQMCDGQNLTQAQWKGFSENLVHALSVDNDGLQQSALRQIARYGDCLEVDEAVFDIVAIYRSHDNDQVRRLAVVALGAMQHRWAMDFLERSVRFEKSATVKNTMQAVLSEYRTAKASA